MNTDRNNSAPPEEGPLISLGTALVVQIEGIPERLLGVLVGVVAGECLIIRGRLDGAEGSAALGRKVTVRYTHGGAMNTFSSEWMGAITDPKELAFLSYPEQIETIELRSHKRRECFLPAELVVGNEVYSGTIQDISEQGCKFILDISGEKKSLVIGESEHVVLVVRMLEAEETQEISGEAKNVHLHAEFDAEEMHVGIKFQGDTADAAESLRRIVDYASAADPF